MTIEPAVVDVSAITRRIQDAFDGKHLPEVDRESTAETAHEDVVLVRLYEAGGRDVPGPQRPTDIFRIAITHVFHRDQDGNFDFEEDEDPETIRSLAQTPNPPRPV
jgi:hypothetical protein